MAKSILVLMSTYNGEKYLEEQIESILNQIGVDVDLLIRDDGSKDGTLRILKDYSIRDNRIKYMQGDNINWMHSFWKLVNMGGGHDYYAFSDQDDIWDKDKLIRAVNILENHNDIPAIYCANQRLINSSGKVVNVQRKKVDTTSFAFQDYLLWGNIFRGCTEVWNNLLQNYVLSKRIEDIDEPHDAFLMQLGLATGFVFKDNNEVMSYRQHHNNAIGANIGIEYIKHNMHTIISTISGESKKECSQRCKKIYKIVKDDIDSEKEHYYNQIFHYDDSVINTIRLAFSRDYQHITKKKRIQILLRLF